MNIKVRVNLSTVSFPDYLLAQQCGYRHFQKAQGHGKQEQPQGKNIQVSLYAFFNPSTSSFIIFSMACMTFSDFFLSGPLNNSARITGTICHDKPNLSFSQPH
jgi:hypothetical protein